MSRQMNQNERKLAEKLTILNNRGDELLTRIYNIKKACDDAKSKPGFLTDKNLESSVKNIVRRFPNVDIKSLTPIKNLKNEIIKSLSSYYYTFLDLLDFKDHVCELLTDMDALQVDLDIFTNTELTKNYLDVVTCYVSLMVLLSRVENRKAILGLYNAAYEMLHKSPDHRFPRLSKMIMDYDAPIKKLCEEFIPHSRRLAQAIYSLIPLYYYIPRNVAVDKLHPEEELNIFGNPAMLLKSVLPVSDKILHKYLSMKSKKWVVFGLSVMYEIFVQDQLKKLLSDTLRSSRIIQLFGDKYIHIYQLLFDTIKKYGKRIPEGKDASNQFLTKVLKELRVIFMEKATLLKPKALMSMDNRMVSSKL